MAMQNTLIKDVSDTSYWVAYYRAKETDRPDALFHDPLSKVLIGDHGKNIAEDMKKMGRYTEWSVVTRTVMIDDYIQIAIKEGIDTVINLGAGLDTRPYRMNLPQSLKWIEIDYSHIVAHKNRLLKSETPRCQLTRIELDLANNGKRSQFLTQMAAQTQKALIITEGVIPYLNESQVAQLGKELQSQPSFAFWIGEFFDPKVYRYIKNSFRMQKMRNAPFQFFPKDWLGFFEDLGWTPKEIRYAGEETLKHGREIPMPWWTIIFRILAKKAVIEKSKRMTGYILFRKS
jgi:methyltransferase (TIGR00027 family)